MLHSMYMHMCMAPALHSYIWAHASAAQMFTASAACCTAPPQPCMRRTCPLCSIHAQHTHGLGGLPVYCMLVCTSTCPLTRCTDRSPHPLDQLAAPHHIR
ncbi:hypothetical protein COO60DRAFT_545754 [Scenedesmus sp. NREL 46B-D3]|nr:hypothetical protein COO60DRAFT_545754 [Scenedesmus sp. NREL 46B-D3]